MVLRSGVIIPFQFRDMKKLIMVGVAEENRELSIWDLKNVVRAAFGIYNFEFRNKKIGFNIPDELLLHYLAQRNDLTNFVIEIGQAIDDAKAKELLSFEPSCSSTVQKQVNTVALPQPSNDSTHHDALTTPNYVAAVMQQRDKSPLDSMTNHSNHSSDPPQKIRITQVYSEQTPESLTQSIDPMDIIPKSEQDEALEMEARDVARYEAREQAIQQQQQQLHQQQQQFFANFGHGMLGNQPPPTSQQQQYSPAMLNRFRRRGERMSKDQKELYVKYFEENPCMLTQRRNDIMLEPHWNKLASLLNNVPQGAVKNVEEWKQDIQCNSKDTRRKRTANFSTAEMDLLLDLMQPHKAILETKRTDAMHNNKKKAAWDEICENYNSYTTGQSRDVDALRLKIQNMKKDLKRKSTSNAGDQPISDNLTATDHKLLSFLSSVEAIDDNSVDCDASFFENLSTDNTNNDTN